MIRRRGLLLGLLAAPAIIRTPGLLMPIVRPYGLVIRRHGAMAYASFKPDPADVYRMAKAIPGFPDWITPEMPMSYCERDLGWAHGYSWEANVYERQA